MSSLLSRVYVERTVHNPTYDIEEGAPSTNVIADSLDTAREPTEVYEEIPNENPINQEEECDVYDVPEALTDNCLLYTSPSPRDATLSRMPSSA